MPNNNKPLLKSFSSDQRGSTRSPMVTVLAIFLAVIFVGVATGWVVAKVENPSRETTAEKTATEDSSLAENEAGIDDESMFEEETPEGILTEGGLDGEGTHHLDRNAGPTKMVYLTSSVINLDDFVGKKVRVWGNTVAAQNAPWLMDVGKIKVIE